MNRTRLKELRLEQRYSQEQLALELNISQASISAYESGDRILSVDMANKICDLFNVSMDYLVRRSEARHFSSHKLSKEDETHLYLYQQLSPYQRELADAYVMGLSQQAR